MAKVKIQGHASGTGVLTVTAPNTSTDRVITLPDEDVTLGAATPSIDDNGDATAITINSSEQVGIGVTSPDTTLHIKGTNQIAKFETTSGTGQNYIRFTGSSGNKGYFGYGGGSNDLLSLFNQENYDMAFGTNDTERMRILAGGGLTFNGDLGTSNALDDYEEGTCTIHYSDGSTTVGTGSNLAKYTKVGRLVTVTGYLNATNIDSLTDGSAIRLTGFPFTNTTDTTFAFFSRNWDVPTGTINIVGYLPSGQTYCTFYAMKDNASYQQIICGNVGYANDLYFGVSYHAS